MAGQVTALGLRNGDPAVLRALLDRRGAAVLAYCEWMCAPSDALEATADAFARFRTIVMNTPRPADIDPEAALLSATRRASAERASSDGDIEGLADLLVGRAEGGLDRNSAKLLHQLLDASPAARATEDRFNAAEHAYRTAVGRPVPDSIADHALAAMLHVGREAEVSPVLEHAMAVAAVAEHAAPDKSPDVEEADEPEVADADTPETREDTSPEDLPDPDATVEWSVPGDDDPAEDLELEIAAAELPRDEEAEDPRAETPEVEAPDEGVHEPGEEEPAIEEPDEGLEEPGVEEPDEALDEPDETVAHSHSHSHSMPTATPAIPRPHLPGRSALAPAAAVVVIATIGAMVASGVFGGNDSSPPLDTGIVPTRALNTIPEGEAGTVISDLRSAADKARQQRLADKRAAGLLPPPVATTPTEPQTQTQTQTQTTETQTTP